MRKNTHPSTVETTERGSRWRVFLLAAAVVAQQHGASASLAELGATSGRAEGNGRQAWFAVPRSVALDSSGNIYVADTWDQTIQKITPGGLISTLAGSGAMVGAADGHGSAARFAMPRGVAVDTSGDVFVADGFNEMIRTIMLNGEVSTLAGSASLVGTANGIGSTPRLGFAYGMAGAWLSRWTRGLQQEAQFQHPYGLAVDGSGNVYVADTYNHTIRLINPRGAVSTLAGLASKAGSADGVGSVARFCYPSGVAVDTNGNVYIADTYNHTIRLLTPRGVVSTLAGFAGKVGNGDGLGSAARFYYPSGVAVDSSGNFYVADSGNSAIRKITPSGMVLPLLELKRPDG